MWRRSVGRMGEGKARRDGSAYLRVRLDSNPHLQHFVRFILVLQVPRWYICL